MNAMQQQMMMMMQMQQAMMMAGGMGMGAMGGMGGMGMNGMGGMPGQGGVGGMNDMGANGNMGPGPRRGPPGGFPDAIGPPPGGEDPRAARGRVSYQDLDEPGAGGDQGLPY